MKKFASLAASGVMLLSMAAPAFANGWFPWWGGWSSDEATVTNVATVNNDLFVKSDTGDNNVGGWFGKVWGALIDTGNASAVAEVSNTVNSNAVAGCDCFDDLSLTNVATVNNDLFVKSDTGDNKIGGWWTFGADLKTGNAVSGVLLDNVVNTNLVGGN